MNAVIKLSPGELSPVMSVALSKLPEPQKKLISAGLQPKIEELPEDEVEEKLIAILSTAFTISGQKQEPATLAIYAAEFLKKLKETYPRVSVEEVALALRAGVYDEYGEFYGLNVRSFIFFIRKYLDSQARKESIQQYDKEQAKALEYQPTEAERERHLKDFINLVYEWHCGGASVDFIPVHFYAYLDSGEYISYTVEEKRAFMRMAEERYKELHEKGTLQYLLAANLPNEKTGKEATVKNIAMRLAVAAFFDKCHEENKASIFE